jgi:hypothetical protein
MTTPKQHCTSHPFVAALRSLLAPVLFCGAIFGGALPALAAETLYQVEIIVFARDSGDSEDSLRSSSELRYPARTVQLGNDGGAPFQALPPTSLQLKREADALGQRRGMRVLAHQAWQWPSVVPAQAVAVAIGGGRQAGAHRELEGYIALSADHFLHIDTQLWLSRFGETGADALPLPPVPGLITSAGPAEAESVASRIFLLREQRRMRSGELHYFDHSRLGLLVQVTPVVAAAANTPAGANTVPTTNAATMTTTATPATATPAANR